ncbi:MAG TPA: ATP-binding cassette domain-containing protein [Candidatus Peribacterales bacterium]|nr:ATP-binding cassette domain-containing protein [Candidatus Peribacterales bacterium]
MLSLKNISWKDGTKILIEDLTCDIAPCECVAIDLPDDHAIKILVQLLMGEKTLQTGGIFIDGIPLGKLTPRLLQFYRRSIGIVLPTEELLMDRSVAENIALPLRARGMSTRNKHEKIETILAKIDLQGKESMLLRHLSHAEQRCVAFAVALVADPQILYIEDIGNDSSDAETQAMIDTLLQEAMNRETSIIIATRTSDRFASLRPRVISRRGETKTSEKLGETHWKTAERTRIIPTAL